MADDNNYETTDGAPTVSKAASDGGIQKSERSSQKANENDDGRTRPPLYELYEYRSRICTR